jgi:5S rRNA maturation endonuclease (ribonuclease M5)
MNDLREVISELKEIDIRDVLNELGINYKVDGKRVNFKIRNERTPSCWAISQNNIWIWKDFGAEEYRGTVIDLWSIVKNVSFIEAVLEMKDIFLKKERKERVNSQKEREFSSNFIKSVEVLERFLDKQIAFLQSRHIYPVPNELKSVVYFINERKLYGIGIKTVNNNWVIRQTTDKAINSEVSKYLFVGGADISYWKGNNDKVVVVEGMFDAGAVRMLEKERNNIIILNSVSNYKKAIEFINQNQNKFRKIILALDNDQAGIETTEKIKKLLGKETVEELKYEGKDLNEYLIIKSQNTRKNTLKP